MSFTFSREASLGRNSENSPRIREFPPHPPFPDPHSKGVAGLAVPFTVLHFQL